MNRREFIVKGSSALSLALVSGKLLAQEAGTVKKFGCQLYSVRDQMPQDPKGTMTKLAEMGYRFFESYSDDPFWGMEPKECQKFLKGLGVKMVSAHRGLNAVTEDFLAKAKEASLEYIVCPYIGMQPDVDAWKKRADQFNEAGALCKKFGLTFGYHNHSYSFAFVSGMKGQLVLLKNTDPDLVSFELDMCWSEAAGENTIAHLQEFGNRYKLCHVKQLKTKGSKPEESTQTDLADGIIDYTKLLRVAKDSGMKYFLVEQEQYPHDSLTSMASDAIFMKKLVF